MENFNKLKKTLKKLIDIPSINDRVDTMEINQISLYKNLNNEKEASKLINLREIGNGNGVYFILNPNKIPIKFKDYINDDKNLINESFSKKELEEKYSILCRNEELSQIIYIGKANHKSQNGLRKRLRQYMKNKRHKGGRTLWQIQNNEKLYLGWIKTTKYDDIDADMLEAILLYNYKKIYESSINESVLPLANRKDENENSTTKIKIIQYYNKVLDLNLTQNEFSKFKEDLDYITHLKTKSHN